MPGGLLAESPRHLAPSGWLLLERVLAQVTPLCRRASIWYMINPKTARGVIPSPEFPVGSLEAFLEAWIMSSAYTCIPPSPCTGDIPKTTP